MNLLITLCLQRSDLTPLMEIPKELLSPAEVEIVGFILAFYAKYKTVPGTERVSAKFPHFLPTVVKDPDRMVLADILEQVKQSKLAHRWQFTLQSLASTIGDGEELPIGELSNLLKLTMMTTGMSAFSRFDRSKYFRARGLDTGLKMIDIATGGVSEGEVMIIAGRLGNKKTTLSLFIAHHWWKQGKRVLFASNEMAPADIYARLDGIVGRFNPLILRGEPTDEVKELVDTTKEMVRITSKEHKGDIFIPSTKLRTPAEVFATAQYLGVDGIIIDGLYLMHPNEGHFGAKWERVSEISNQIKEGAGDTGIPTLALTQIKRVGGRKESYDAEDLAYSDAIGQDADFILVSNPSIMDKNKLELQLVKNRYGKEISTICAIDFDRMTLVEESVLTDEMDAEEWFTPKTKTEEAKGEWITA